MWKSKLALSLLAASVLLAGCKVQTVQQYENEQKNQSEKVVVVDEKAKQKVEDNKEKEASKTKDIQSDEKEQPTKEEENAKVKEQPNLAKQTTSKTASEGVIEEQPVSKNKAPTSTKVEVEKAPVKSKEKKEKAKQAENPTKKEKRVNEKASTKTTVAPKANSEKTTASSSTMEIAKKPTQVKEQEKKEYATVSIGLTVLLNADNYEKLPEALQSSKYVPSNGVIMSGAKVEIKDGAKAWDAIFQVAKKYNIPIDYKKDPLMGIYIEGINHIYEKQAGSNSGWMYTVNGVKASVGVGNYVLKANDSIEIQFTTNGGTDLGW